MFVREEEELPRVMREIADALRGAGAALTIHPDGRPPRLLWADEPAGVSAPFVERLLAEREIRPAAEPGRHVWLRPEGDARFADAVTLPVQRVPGHSPLVITVFFDSLTEAARGEAERAYTARRPFAVGYFRLWQLDRAHLRRLRAAEEALDLVELGVTVLDGSGRILFANRTARGLFDNGDGLRERDGRLAAAQLGDAARLGAAIGHVLDQGGAPGRVRRSPMLSVGREGKAALVVAVLPTALPPEEEGDAAATVFALDPALDLGAALRPVCKLYGLSNVESELVAHLAAGANLGEAAVAMRIKEATARSYLKQVFLKTGARRQTDLVRVMLLSLLRTAPRTAFEVV